jgi:hypothetical protein
VRRNLNAELESIDQQLREAKTSHRALKAESDRISVRLGQIPEKASKCSSLEEKLKNCKQQLTQLSQMKYSRGAVVQKEAMAARRIAALESQKRRVEEQLKSLNGAART